MAIAQPATRPANPRFSSGPCAKIPTFELNKLADAALGRSHRAAVGKDKLKAAIEETRDLPFVQWRGRWQDMKTLVHYLQESLVHSWHLRLSAKARKRILMLQNMFERAIA